MERLMNTDFILSFQGEMSQTVIHTLKIKYGKFVQTVLKEKDNFKSFDDYLNVLVYTKEELSLMIEESGGKNESIFNKSNRIY